MVFTTEPDLVRSRGPDETWRKNKILRLAAHFRGRPKNCYGLAIRAVHHALVYMTKMRALRRSDRKLLREQRISAGAREYGTRLFPMREGLDRAGVALNRMTLADLAVWETRSFGALASLAKQTVRGDAKIAADHDDAPVDYVEWKLFTRGKIP